MTGCLVSEGETSHRLTKIGILDGRLPGVVVEKSTGWQGVEPVTNGFLKVEARLVAIACGVPKASEWNA